LLKYTGTCSDSVFYLDCFSHALLGLLNRCLAKKWFKRYIEKEWIIMLVGHMNWNLDSIPNQSQAMTKWKKHQTFHVESWSPSLCNIWEVQPYSSVLYALENGQLAVIFVEKKYESFVSEVMDDNCGGLESNMLLWFTYSNVCVLCSFLQPVPYPVVLHIHSVIIHEMHLYFFVVHVSNYPRLLLIFLYPVNWLYMMPLAKFEPSFSWMYSAKNTQEITE
jgi:hypothetical protein